jgi:1-aminocyclopropane-1-carboxylate deaminase/D-cysteine desulfhydrase-like pyridoxal-dependent ACC family enzyme
MSAPLNPAAVRERLGAIPSLALAPLPSAVEPMPRLSAALGGGPRLLVKRDDAIGFACGGNKVRKLALLAAAAQAEGSDTLITAGAIQSNHARVTAAVAARLGMHAILVVNGTAPERPSGNALVDALLGAELVYVASREDRAPAIHDIGDRLRAAGHRPFEIPVGGSTPLGALAFVAAMLELLDQIPPPDVIFHATSSGGTQAGLVAACRLLRLPTRVVGISADDQVAPIHAQIRANVSGIAELLGIDPELVSRGAPIEIDDRFVGPGYGIVSDAAREAIDLAARREALLLDPVYTGKAMAGMMAYVRQQRFDSRHTLLFWHTGGQLALFA